MYHLPVHQRNTLIYMISSGSEWFDFDIAFSRDADVPDVVFTRHGKSSSALRASGGREIRPAHGESATPPS